MVTLRCGEIDFYRWILFFTAKGENIHQNWAFQPTHYANNQPNFSKQMIALVAWMGKNHRSVRMSRKRKKAIRESSLNRALT